MGPNRGWERTKRPTRYGRQRVMPALMSPKNWKEVGLMERQEMNIGSSWELTPSTGYAGIERGVVTLKAIFDREMAFDVFPSLLLESYDIPELGYIPPSYAVLKYHTDRQILVLPLDVFNDHAEKLEVIGK